MYKILLILLTVAFFTACRHEGPGAAKDKANAAEPGWADIGMNYAMAAQKLLGQNLTEAIQSKGLPGALEFCNVQAIPLTDSVSRQYNAVIRRVSDKPRNPGNQANAEELQHIARYKQQLAAGEKPEPVVLHRNGIAQFYYPITTNGLCLQCHGPHDSLQAELLQKLTVLYPDDKATGYSLNEVRGIWSIAFRPEAEK